uniref:Uncharacterized protein n=1 Tax=uncultured bacterium A1Q1_fos_500 TaxID=1256579 RepID=L7W0L0_9BACT|nr:hypothetical protein [uncultured bacterium A1Q1_fos_500]
MRFMAVMTVTNQAEKEKNDRERIQMVIPLTCGKALDYRKKTTQHRPASDAEAQDDGKPHQNHEKLFF